MKSCISFSAVPAWFAFSVRAASVLAFARSDPCKSDMVFIRAWTYCRLTEGEKIMTRRDVPRDREVGYNRKFPRTAKDSYNLQSLP